MDSESVNTLLAAIAAPLATAIISAFGVFASFALVALRKRFANEAADSALQSLGRIIEAIVTDLNQTMVDDIKRFSKDGKLDAVDRQHIKQTAIVRVKNTAGKHLSKELKNNFGDLDTLISSMIEAAVNNSRWYERVAKKELADDKPG